MDKREAYHKQMTETSIAPLIIKLGIPTTISMLITNVYNLVDTYFVGTLGVAQQGATGILFTLQAILQAVAFGLGHGAATHMTKHLALKNKKEAEAFGSNAFYLGLAIGVLMLGAGLLFLEPLMLLLGSSDTILPYARDYGFWVLISGPFFVTSLVLNVYLRYEGKATFAMIGIVSGALLNVLGDFIFISVLGMGVFGAGLSTAISQIVSFVIILAFYLKVGQVGLRVRSITFKWSYFANIFVAGLPSMLRQGLASLSGGILNNLTKPFGDAAVAAMAVVNRYSNFVMCIGLGIGQGLQPVAAYNYAVKEYGRVRKGIYFTVGFSTAVVGVVSTLTLIFPSFIVSWFNSNEEVIRLGTIALRYAAISLFFNPLGAVANMSLQSVRKSGISSFLSALRCGLAFIPIIFLFVYAFQMGFEGIAWSQPAAEMLTFVISLPFLLHFTLQLNRLERERKEAEALPEEE